MTRSHLVDCAGRLCRAVVFASVALATALLPRAAGAEEKTFAAGSLIIPMDLAYQDTGILQAYGLVFQLLRQGVPVSWVIDPDKTWHAADCDTPADLCTWDCAIEGSGVKCPYPTASPDFFAPTKVVSDSAGTLSPGDAISSHGYRGGPFLIDASNATAALAIIEAWNDNTMWAANPWAMRSIAHVVSVHETTAPLTANVAKQMVAAPTIAVFADGNEDIANGYLRNAGIPQSNGAEFFDGKCGAANCGPGTANPDMLTVPSIMGDMGTCDAPNFDHKNGSLFTADGLPAYCQIMSMHWGVNDREDVQCDGKDCPATQAECAGKPITYHGHEVVAEVRSFLTYPTHFFAECQAVNAYENTVPNPAWPYLDDADRRGHFLTTEGMPPACPCTDGDFECVVGGCGGVDCCLPKDVKEKGAGFMIAAQPDSTMLKILRPDVAYNQMDGAFQTVGGSEPAYNLSTYLGTKYINDRDVTFITGPNGPGDQDVWMTGYLDGSCDIGGDDDIGGAPGACNGGKVSYLGGHSYKTDVGLIANEDSQGARLFLNALFEADCVTAAGQPQLSTSLAGSPVAAQTVPVTADLMAQYQNTGLGLALDAMLSTVVPSTVTVKAVGTGAATATGVEWTVGSISPSPAQAGDPPSSGDRTFTVEFPDFGDYEFEVHLSFRVGVTVASVSSTVQVRVLPDMDGDGVVDEDDPFPNDNLKCGDSDSDTCDDCSVAGMKDPANDGPDADGDGICDAGDPDPGVDGDDSGCGCQAPATGGSALIFFVVGALLLIRRRRGSRQRRD